MIKCRLFDGCVMRVWVGGKARRVQDFWTRTRTRLIKIVRPGPGPATSLHA